MDSSSIPEILQMPQEMVEITFVLRDCELMKFKESFDKNSSSIYDLMYAVSKNHGGTVETDKVQIFQKLNDDEFVLEKDITKKLRLVDKCDTFYYDFAPVDGKLLLISQQK